MSHLEQGAPLAAYATFISAPHLNIEHEAVPKGQSIAGAPTTGFHQVGDYAGHEVGIWEMSTGTMTDVETDELFVVISGSATVEIKGQPGILRLAAGDVVTLHAGMETVWAVTETLRKVYIA